MLSSEEDHKLKIQQSLKDVAIKEQKIEFQDIQITEMQSQLEEANKQHQQMVEAMKELTEREQNKQEDEANADTPGKAERLQRQNGELKL